MNPTRFPLGLVVLAVVALAAPAALGGAPPLPASDAPYSTFLGGAARDVAHGVALDADGNAWIAGETTSADFPLVTATRDHFEGGGEAFIARFAPDGSLAFSTFLGGDGLDQALAVASDADGNAYVGGLTRSSDFPTVGAAQPAYGGGSWDFFVTKVTPDGSIAYSTYLGGSGTDVFTDLAVADDGTAYVLGYTTSGNFPGRGGAQPAHGGGWWDGVVVKLTPDGALAGSTYLGGRSVDTLFGLAVAPDGDVVVTGHTRSVNFPTVNPVQDAHAGGTWDVVVARLTGDLGTLRFSTYLGGSGIDTSWGEVAVDADGHALVGAGSTSTDFPTVDATQAGNAGGWDAIVARFTPGGGLAFATHFGGTGDEYLHHLVVGADGDWYLTGPTTSTDLPTVAAHQAENGGGRDAFVARFTPDGAVAYASYLGGGEEDNPQNLAVDPFGNVVVVGRTASADYPTAPAPNLLGGGPAQGAHGGDADAFVTLVPTCDRGPLGDALATVRCQTPTGVA